MAITRRDAGRRLPTSRMLKGAFKSRCHWQGNVEPAPGKYGRRSVLPGSGAVRTAISRRASYSRAVAKCPVMEGKLWRPEACFAALHKQTLLATPPHDR